jgi:predicted GIY-YIG superfamily endonuclease
MSFYSYIALCRDNTLYTGYCKNLESREDKHNIGEGAKYTKQRRPIKIIYFEEFDNRKDAMKRERQIKKLSRYEKENLIKINKAT